MRRLIPLLLAVALLTSSCGAQEPMQAGPNNLGAPEKAAEITFEELTEVLRERRLSDWQVKLLNNLSFGTSEILELTDVRLKELFAPGAQLGGVVGLHDVEKHDALVARGLDPQDLTILIKLGFDGEKIEQLSTGQMGFILPNTELIDKLVALGYEREQIDCLARFGSQAGTDTET